MYAWRSDTCFTEPACSISIYGVYSYKTISGLDGTQVGAPIIIFLSKIMNGEVFFVRFFERFFSSNTEEGL